MKRKDILMILVPSVIFVILWIIFGVFHNLRTSTVSQTLDSQISPISPIFDMATLDKLKARTQINPVFENASASAVITPTPVPQLTPTPIASPTPSLPASSSAQASPGGNLLP